MATSKLRHTSPSLGSQPTRKAVEPLPPSKPDYVVKSSTPLTQRPVTETSTERDKE